VPGVPGERGSPENLQEVREGRREAVTAGIQAS
jgi:hypothetical protein